MKAPVFWLWLATAAGIVVADALEVGVTGAMCVLLAWAALIALAVRRSHGIFLASLGGFWALGLLASASTPAPPPLQLACEAAPALVQLELLEVRGREQRGAEIGRPVLARLIAQRCSEIWQPASGTLALELRGGEALGRGDVVAVQLTFTPIEPPRNPTDVDPRYLARRDGLSAFATARSPHAHLRYGRGLFAWLDRARDRTGARFEQRLSPDLATIAKALSSGDQSAVEPELRERWARSGLAHILSVSGLHVSLVALLCYALLYHLLASVPWLAERLSLRRAAALATLPAVVLFCVWAGAPPAAVRATVMAGAGLCGVALLRPSATLNAVGIAGLAILIVAPFSLYDPGFLLSFIAVLGLLAAPQPPPAMTRLERWRRLALGLLVASLVASAVTAPISAYFFGQVSLIAPLANLVGVPLGSVVATPLALLYTLVSPLWPALADLVAAPLAWALGLLDGLAALSARLPLAAVDLPRPGLVDIVAWLLGLAALSWASGRRRLVALGLAASVLLGNAAVARLLDPGRGRLTLLHPYVGQGDGALVRLPEGGVVLVDAGGGVGTSTYDPGRAVMAPLLRRQGVRALDLVVVSHPHPDHLEGFAYLARHFPIHELWWNGAGEELPTMRALLGAVAASGGQARLLRDLPPRLEREGVTFELWHPRPGPEAEGLAYDPQLSANDNSIVLGLRLGERSVLLTGDIERDSEARLAALLPSYDIVKTPHHGSATSSTAPWLAAVRPRLAVMSLGVNNHFGFPAAEVLSRYAGAGVTVLRTDQDGLVELSTDGKSWRVTTQRGKALQVP